MLDRCSRTTATTPGAGGYSYYNENVRQFAQAAAGRGYEPTTVAEYLAEHPVPAGDVVHVEDGGWVNADGDFGSPQFINWNWPLVNAAGQLRHPGRLGRGRAQLGGADRRAEPRRDRRADRRRRR